MGEGHDHGASALDVEGELRAPLRRLGMGFLVVGVLALSGGLWLVSRSHTVAGPSARVEAALEALAELAPGEIAARAAAHAADDAAAWWWAGELARRAGDAALARTHFERAAALAPEREEPRRALEALNADGGAGPAWIDERAAAALEGLVLADFPAGSR